MSRCMDCGGPLRKNRGDYRFEESGLKNVVLRNIELLHCNTCAQVTPRLPRMNDLMRTLALAVIAQPFELAAEDVRFLRKFLGLNGEEFARLLDVDRATLSRWETGDQRPGAQSDRLIRLVALGLGEGLKEKAEGVIRRFTEIQAKRRPGLSIDTETMQAEYRIAA